MAGYTSRLLLKLTISATVALISVYWFLKRKKLGTLKDCSTQFSSDHLSPHGSVLETSENSIVITSKKLKHLKLSIANYNNSFPETKAKTMQLKEKMEETSSPNDAMDKKQPPVEISPRNKGKHKKKIKSKVRENGTSCISKICNKETVDSEVENDKDRDSGVDVTNGVEHLEDATIQDSLIANGIESLHLCDAPVKNTDPQFSPTADFSTSCEGCTPLQVPLGAASMNEVLPNILSVHNEVSEKVLQVQSSTCSADAISPKSNDSAIDVSHREMENIVAAEGEQQQIVQVTEAEIPGNIEDMASPDSCVYLSVYEFEIPQQLCGLLIGRNGRYVNHIKQTANADIVIVDHPYSLSLKVCRMSGTEGEIDHALSIIRTRFPDEEYDVSLNQVNLMPTECVISDNLRMSLPEAIHFDVVLSATVTAGHFFVQQPTHPTYHSLNGLYQRMTMWYDGNSSPQLTSFAKGNICVAPVVNNGWFRVEITDVSEDSAECTIKYIDYGGYSRVPSNSLRQIRHEFMNVPFQASECYLGSVTVPNGQETWSQAATKTFESLAQRQILRGFIVAYAPDGIPFVHLFSFQGANTTFINRELVLQGMAQWIEHKS